MVARPSNSSSSPKPAKASAPTPPPPITNPHEFLHALITSNFNFPQVAARLTPAQLLKFIADELVEKKLQSLLAFNTLCITLRQSQARHAALHTLQALVESVDSEESPAEKRRAATSLLRATTPARLDIVDNQQAQAPAPPRPVALPRADLTAHQVAELLLKALHQPNTPEEESGLATIAAFADHDAVVNREPVTTDEPTQCIDDLLDTEIANFRQHRGGYIDKEPKVSDDKATFVYELDLTRGNELCRELWIELARSPDSKHPGCWLIEALSTGPPNYYRLQNAPRTRIDMT